MGKEELSVSKDSSMDCLNLIGFFSAHDTMERLTEGNQNAPAPQSLMELWTSHVKITARFFNYSHIYSFCRLLT